MADDRLTIEPDGTITSSGRVDLLFDVDRQGSTAQRIRDLETRIRALERAGSPRTGPDSTIVIGSATEDIRVEGKLKIGPVTLDPEGEESVIPPLLTVAHEMLIADAGGTQDTAVVGSDAVIARVGSAVLASLGVATNEVLGRAGGSLAALAVAAQQIFARAGGNLGGITINTNEIVARDNGNLGGLSVAQDTFIGRETGSNLNDLAPLNIIEMLNRVGWPVTAVKINGTYNATEADFFIPVDPDTSDLTVDLPTNPPNGNMKIIFDVDAGIASGQTLTITVGAGDTLNGAAGPWGPNSTTRQTIMCIFESTRRDWTVRRFREFTT